MKVLLLVFLLFSCSKKMDRPSSAMQEMKKDVMAPTAMDEKFLTNNEVSPSSPKDRDQEESKEQADKQSKIEKVDLTNPFTDVSKERLIEYSVSLQYTTKEFKESRKKLLTILGKDSIITRSSINSHSSMQNMEINIMVKANKLYEQLLEIDKIGTLTSEVISTNDFTASNYENKVKMDRESIRSQRIAKASAFTNTANKNWKEVEDTLSFSEDKLDTANIEDWKQKDRVTWAKVHISVVGSELPPEVYVPLYKKAFVNSINFLLELLYGLVWLIPILATVTGIYFSYKFIKLKKKE